MDWSDDRRSCSLSRTLRKGRSLGVAADAFLVIVRMQYDQNGITGGRPLDCGLSLVSNILTPER